MNRRKFIRDSGLLSTSMMLPSFARSEDSWSGGQIQHLIPLSNHDRIVLKVSFAEPQQDPLLRIGRTTFRGRKTDTLGRFWTFHAEDLESNQEYELTLEQQGSRYANSWLLSTAPVAQADPESMRILVFTCGGGPDNAQTDTGVCVTYRYLPGSGYFNEPSLLPRILLLA